MTIYWIIKLSIFGSCLFELSKKKKVKFFVLAILCIAIALFGGLRWETGNDWDQYYDLFRRSQWSNIFNMVRYEAGISTEFTEPGFVFLNTLIKSLLKTFYWYNIIICSFIQLSYYKFIKYHCFQHPLLLYAVINQAFLMFPVRAGLAVAICLWAFRYIKERKFLPFLLIIAVASLIHYQCLVFFPLYWIGFVRLNWIIYFMILASSLTLGKMLENYIRILSLVTSGELGDKFQKYTEMEGENFSSVGILNVFLVFLLLLIYLYMLKHHKLGDKMWSYTLINIFVIYESIRFFFLSSDMVHLSRIGDPISVIPSLLYIFAIGFFVKSKRPLIAISSVFFFILYYIKALMGFGSDYYFGITCIPYRSIFDFGYL